MVICQIMLCGCHSSSGLVNMWRDKSYEAAPMNNILVIAVRRDVINRRLWEDSFVGELQKRGVTATASYSLFPGSVPDTQQVIEVIQNKRFDGVLVTVRPTVDTNVNYTPGYVSSDPVMRYNSWTNRYNTYYYEVYHPAEAVPEKVVRHEIDLWSTGDHGKIIWAATTETIDPNSVQDVSREASQVIIPELENQQLIKPR